MAQSASHEQRSSRTGFILAAVGAAVGLGNIWKFPYLAGTSGGSAFVLVYLIAVVLIAIPILMAELMIGRRGQQSPPNAMLINAEKEGQSRAWMGVGLLGALVGFLILSFYSVIGGWVLDYVFSSVTQGFTGTTAEQSQARYNTLLTDPPRLLFWFTIFMGLTAFIVSAGLQKGIERVSKILMPSLFSMLVILVIYSAVAGDFGAGLRFLFEPDFSKLDVSIILAAIGQAFFSIGVSMGLMMAYGSYLPQTVSIPRTALIIASADTLVALMAGLVIFPLVFANGLAPNSGPGLIFVTLPIAFGGITGGDIFGAVFFILLLFAAVTSSIAIMEPGVAWVEERWGISRRFSAFSVGVAAWIVGLTSAFSFNLWAEFKPIGGMTFFALTGYLTDNIMMPVGGMLIAVFAGWFMSRETLLSELGMQDSEVFQVWRFLVRTLVPLAIAAILITNYL
ncbi:MAG: sodium-dependent transporter [Pseudomonadota bacterium]